MPKPRHVLLPEELQRLRSAMEERLGFLLDRKSACTRASDEMRILDGSAPSATTLHGLFVRPDGRTPYLETLHLMARFVGKRDWHDFQGDDPGLVEAPRFRLDPVHALPNMLISCMRRGQHGVLDDLFDAWSERLDDPGIYDVGLCIYVALYTAPDVAMPFYQRYAGHPTVRTGFFELLADPEFRLHGYAEGLAQYHAATGASDDAMNFRDRLFADTMIFRHHVLKGDPQAVARGSGLYTTGMDASLLNGTHVFLVSRYLAYALWYDVMQRRSARRKRRERTILEWAAGRLSKCSTQLERDIILYNLLEGFLRVGTIKEVMHDLLSLFPELDPELAGDEGRLRQVLAECDPNGIHRRFRPGPSATPPGSR
jgi:hypothetical protein